MIREDPGFFLPNMLFFENGNGYVGSVKNLRFLVRPVDGEQHKEFDCLDWFGEYGMEDSSIQRTARFPMTDEGREQVIDWLDGEYARMREESEETG